MIVGNFNFHQILFALDTFKETEEKTGYLEKIQHELKRIVDCFEGVKTLPLQMYATQTYNVDEGCDELVDFIKLQFEGISSNPYDKSSPGESELRGLVRTELVNYQKMLAIVEDEIASIRKKMSKREEGTKRKEIPQKMENTNRGGIPKRGEIPKREENKKKEIKFIKLERYSPHIIKQLLTELKGQKIIWNSSIGELIDLVKVMIILELVDKLDENNLPKFIANNFVNSGKEKYTVPQIDKVYQMLQNTFWLNRKSESLKYLQ